MQHDKKKVLVLAHRIIQESVLFASVQDWCCDVEWSDDWLGNNKPSKLSKRINGKLIRLWLPDENLHSSVFSVLQYF